MKTYGLDLVREAEEQRGDEWIFGAASPACLFAVPRGERHKYLPEGELQNIGEEKSGCVTRFYHNKLETKLTYADQKGILLPELRKWGRDNGYVVNNKWVLSDAFNEILSGTTRTGNSFKAPADSIRKDGIVPKSKLPQLDSFDAHYDPQRITPELRTLGKEFLRRFSLNYEQVYLSDLEDALEKDLVGIGIYAYPQEINGEYPRTEGVFNHAVMAFDRPLTFIFDNYIDSDGDFIKKLAKDYVLFPYGYRLYVSAQNIPNALADLPPAQSNRLLDWLVQMFIWITSGAKPPMPAIPQEILPDPKPVQESNREKLHEEALFWVGKDASPSDLAPDEFGCAESLNEIHRAVFGSYISKKNPLSTYWMYRDLKESLVFEEVSVPLSGDVIISPTGYGRPGSTIKNGHCGVLTDNGRILSNDSRTGKWMDTHSIDSWRLFYGARGGYPVRFFRRK